MSVECCEPRRLFAAAATFTVLNADDSGPGSLRQAILDANANLNDANPDGTRQYDTIVISTQGLADKVVDLASPLPAITDPVNLGVPPETTPPPGPYLELNGAAAGVGANGLVLTSTATASQVSNLAINRFSGHGIVIQADNSGVLGAMHVGTDLAGTATNLGNAGHGILITGDNNLVGDAKVVFNGLDGISVAGTAGNFATNNVISFNSPASEIRSNGGLAIDLGNDGLTPNDPGDVDGGDNGLQNTPVITDVIFNGNEVTVSGTINTRPDAAVSLDFFTTPVARREGWQPLTLVDGGGPLVTADANGNATFTFTLVPVAGTLSPSSYVTAVATAFDLGTGELNTSEFSAPVGLPPAWLAPGSLATWDAEAGTLTVTGAASIIADPGPAAPLVTASGSGAVLTIAPPAGSQVNLGGLQLSDSASANVANTGAARVVVIADGANFTLDPTATLDLTDNALVVRNASQAAAAAEHASVNGLVRNAFSEFAWTGTGITSSTAAADVATGTPSTLGILLNNDGAGGPLFYGPGTDQPTFMGAAVDSNTVMVRFTRLGDGDLNGVVDSVDFALFQAGYTGAAPYVGFAFGDYDYNGVIDSVDFGLFQAGYTV